MNIKSVSRIIRGPRFRKMIRELEDSYFENPSNYKSVTVNSFTYLQIQDMTITKEDREPTILGLQVLINDGLRNYKFIFNK